MWFIVAAVIFLVYGSAHLLTRYQYAPRSRRALALAAAGSYVVAVLVMARLFPGLRGAYLYGWAVLAALVVFVAVALVLVEGWRKWKQREFDRHVAFFRQREEECRHAIDAIDRDLARQLARRRSLEDGHGNELEDFRRLRQAVEAWEQGGGVARIRGVKVRDWQAEFEALPAEVLRERVDRLAAELETARETDRERAAQLEAQLSLARLVQLGDRGAQPAQALGAAEHAILELRRAREERERELAQARREAEEWERRRSLFLSKRILLD